MFNVPDCEYIWPIRDRMFFKEYNVYKYIVGLTELNPTIISLFCIDRPKLPVNFFYSKQDYIREFLESMALLGSYILKKKLIKLVNKSYFCKKYAISWIHVIMALLCINNENNFLGIQTHFDDNLLHCEVNTHSWDKTDDYITAMFEDKLYCVEDFVKFFFCVTWYDYMILLL